MQTTFDLTHHRPVVVPHPLCDHLAHPALANVDGHVHAGPQMTCIIIHFCTPAY